MTAILPSVRTATMADTSEVGENDDEYSEAHSSHDKLSQG